MTELSVTIKQEGTISGSVSAYDGEGSKVADSRFKTIRLVRRFRQSD